MKIFWLKDTCISTPSWLWKVIGVMGGGGRYRFWYKKKNHIIDCLNNKIVTNEKCITLGGRGGGGTDHTNFALFSTYANNNTSGNKLCSHCLSYQQNMYKHTLT